MATPTEWLNEFQVNTGTAAAGGQSDPKIIGLSNGNILVAWTESASGSIGTPAGTDIIGKIYDAEGNLVRDAYRINVFANVDDERDFDIAATNDGGFIMVYVDDDISNVNQTAIIWSRHNAAGNQTNASSIQFENVAADFLRNPQVAVNLLDNTSVVTYTDDVGANTDINGRSVSDTGVAGAEFDAAQNSGDADRDGDVAILQNGNFVSVYEELDGATTSLEAKIFTTTGQQVALIGVAGTGFDPQVASLDNGNFVVVWENAGDIFARVYGPTGTAATGQITVASGGNSQNEPDVVALPDGDFVVVWDDDTSNNLFARRYNPTGTTDGFTFTVENVGTTSPDIGVTGDGRILFSWIQEGSGEVFASIWDPRSNPIDTVDYGINLRNFVNTDIVTSRTVSTTVNGDGGPNTILGQGGNDLLLGGGGADSIVGGAGNDIIEGGFFTDTVEGGAGNDFFRVRAGEFIDNVNGGSGTDILDHSALALLTGATFNFAAGTATSTRQTPPTVTLASIEEYRDSNGSNTIIDRAGTFTIRANGGNDTVREDASGGTDDFDLGSGNDTLEINNTGIGGDIFQGGIGTDLADFSNVTYASGTVIDLLAGEIRSGGASEILAGFENVIGSGGNDSIIGSSGANDLDGGAGNDTLKGGLGADNLDGGAGFDTADYFGSDDGLGTLIRTIVRLDTGANGVAASGDTLVNIEAVVGTSLNDVLFGDSGANRLDGRGGIDQLAGNAGPDTINGGPGNGDNLNYTLSPAGVEVRLAQQSASGGDADGDVLTGIEWVTGSAFNDILVGDFSPNRISGRGGNDTVNGGGGADLLFGGPGSNTFEYFTVSHSTSTVTDVIVDFTSADVIDLSSIDANTGLGGNQAFGFIGGAAFSSTAGELRFDTTTSFVEGDVNGDSVADLVIDMNGLASMNAGDFFL